MVWKECKSERNGKLYYYNKETKETSWVKPEGFDSTSSRTPSSVKSSELEEYDSPGIYIYIYSIHIFIIFHYLLYRCILSILHLCLCVLRM